MTLTSEYLRRLRQETDIDRDNCIHLLIFILLRPPMRLARKVVNMKSRRSIRIMLTTEIKNSEIRRRDRKSTRLNSSHTVISYAVFCLKKKNKIITNAHTTEVNCIVRQ